MSLTPQALLAELDTTLPQVEESWRSTVLRKITDLFLSGADLYNDQHVALFDAVMSRLLPGLDRDDLAELGNRLAGIANAPLNVLASLARHLDILVCGPVLEQAKALPDKVLAEAADRDRVDPNILAKIAARPRLGESVTDVLLKRGGLPLQRKILDNPDTRISEGGFARVIMGLDGDKELAQAVAARNDLPPELRLWLKDILGQ
jgi:uncharacterized protein (DUF2336 family)